MKNIYKKRLEILVNYLEEQEDLPKHETAQPIQVCVLEQKQNVTYTINFPIWLLFELPTLYSEWEFNENYYPVLVSKKQQNALESFVDFLSLDEAALLKFDWSSSVKLLSANIRGLIKR